MRYNNNVINILPLTSTKSFPLHHSVSSKGAGASLCPMELPAGPGKCTDKTPYTTGHNHAFAVSKNSVDSMNVCPVQTLSRSAKLDTRTHKFGSRMQYRSVYLFVTWSLTTIVACHLFSWCYCFLSDGRVRALGR
jgi:hypothetical protein